MTQSFEHHLLIAMPSLNDPYFHRSVVYLCEHDEEGAMGLIINQPVDISLEELLIRMKLKPNEFSLSPESNNQVYMGGPVSTERGFVLHSEVTGLATSHRFADGIMLTSSRDVLDLFGSERQPSNYLVALGYAGWSPGQLEQEIVDNSWLTVPATPELIFELPAEQIWQQAAATIGIDVGKLSTDIGHA